MKRTGALLTALTLAITLSACGGSKDGQSTNEPAVAEVAEEATPEPEPEPVTEPEPEKVDTIPLGVPVVLSEAEVTVQSVTQETELPGNMETITAGDGTLFLLTMEWTNKSKAAAIKKCWGPDTVNMQVYDTQDRELLLSDESGGIPGNDCSNGLLTGESGPWLAAYNGLADSEVGYIILTDYVSGKQIPILVDETIELTRGS